jgi:hypothetical protein
MSSKAARRKRRLEAERRELASRAAQGVTHTQCSDVGLAELAALLSDADVLLEQIVAIAADEQSQWPQVPAAYELRATIEEVRAASAASRAKLAVAHERTRRFLRSGVHVHLCGDLPVRMVPLAQITVDTPPEPATMHLEPYADDEPPF